MKIKQNLVVLLFFAMCATPAFASIGGKPVILIHGFDFDHLTSPPKNLQEVIRDGRDRFKDFWRSRSEAQISYDSSERIERGISRDAYYQLRKISKRGLCNSGCVIVAHSTGAILSSHLIANQARWLRREGLRPLKITAVVDFGAADGGTELADLAMFVANNNGRWVNRIKRIFERFLWAPRPNNMGVVNDLKPNKARTFAIATGIPRLRVVGAGNPYWGATAPLIRGKDDGIVPLHSACGSTKPGWFNSCKRRQAMDGKLTWRWAPRSLWYNYHPIVMAKDATHSGMIGSQGGVTATPVLNNRTLNGIRVAFAERRFTKRPWWKWWGGDQYVVVPGSNRKNLSKVVYDSLR